MTTTHPDRDTCLSAVEAHTIDPELAVAAAGVLKAVADPLRLRMLALIASAPDGEACVCDLSELAEVSGPTVSHHLKTLKDAGVVTSARRGTWVYYRVAEDLVPTVRALMETLVPAVATAPSDRAGAKDEGRGIPELDNVDRALAKVEKDLVARFPDLDASTVVRVVRESHTALSRRAAIKQHLVPLTRHFARQRLADLRKIASPDVPHAPQVLFVCVQNAGRSQLAAALVHRYAGERVTVRSAGSMPAASIHAAVRERLDAIGAAHAAFPKPLTDDAVRASDVVITMGCGDVCPIYPGTRYEDWQVGDPAVASPAGIAAIVDDIDQRVRALLRQLLPDLELPAAQP
ncbi:metalloregulator ArsR/SmtB family transcription factor [Demequina sp. NBRC 110053]|uniref:metalloregulator ArsR/SmtB family transcription factor n=1 Tax=Demequina sp. NBRC 110053 TaxID=1570342 RepID=UPI0009FDA3D5|nr:metalloregulator ArsR/SmtB family transcription factor [Demequina sp. NBRC 110053]